MKLYPAVEIKTSRVISEVVLAELDVHGPTAFEDIPGGIRVFFADAATRNDAIRTAGALPNVSVTPADVSDEDWAARSQASLTPITIDDICVTPPWAIEAARASGATQVIVIQPSMGFGTGHHASTRLCLRWLQQIPIAGTRVLDVGTGSGVLAIAAVVLGASSALGIDFDEDAITAARENVELNRAGSRVELRVLTLDAAAAAGQHFDRVIANITGALIASEAEKLRRLAGPRGILIASGFQTHERGQVTAALEAAGWSAEAELEEDSWLGVLYRA